MVSNSYGVMNSKNWERENKKRFSWENLCFDGNEISVLTFASFGAGIGTVPF